MTIHYYLILFIFIFSCVSKSDAVVILVHGSFATFSTWCKPNGAFFQELEKQAAKFNQKVVPFSWSGIPQDSHIILGAEALAKTILSYPAEEEIILIGHSHGGNVINFASHLLHDSLGEMFSATSCPTISSIISQAYQSNILGNQNTQEYTITTKQPKNNPIFKATIQAINSVENHKLSYKTRHNNQKKFMIEKVYVLGTPVHTEKYPPQMKTINQYFNLYSTGDFIQPVFGLYKRTYPLHERLVNLSVAIQNTGSFLRPNKPKHHELHHTLVAQWLLAIPEILKTKKLGNFEQFSFNKNGSIFFSHKQSPFYQITHKKKSLRIF